MGLTGCFLGRNKSGASNTHVPDILSQTNLIPHPHTRTSDIDPDVSGLRLLGHSGQQALEIGAASLDGDAHVSVRHHQRVAGLCRGKEGTCVKGVGRTMQGSMF